MSEAIIDPQVYNEISELMDDALGAFIETYLDNSPKLLKNIQQAVLDEDLETIVGQAHQLRGGSGSIGAMQVFQLARVIEEKARDKQLEGLDSLVVELGNAYELAAGELKSRLK